MIDSLLTPALKGGVTTNIAFQAENSQIQINGKRALACH